MNASLIHRDCPVCGGSVSTPHWQKGELHLVRCGDCGMIHANPVPAAMASGEFYDAAGTDYYLSPAKLESDYADVRFERELRLFRKHCPRGLVLDVGCSSGAFLFQLRQRWPGDYEALGTDVSGPPLDYAKSRGVPVVRGDFLNQDFGGCTFDSITFWAVIEHLLEPRPFLDKAWALLKPAGCCFVLVPNLQSLAVRLLGVKYRYILPQHVNYFTAATLEQLVVSGRKFRIIDSRSMHFNPLVIWQDWKAKGKIVSDGERALLLKKTTSYKRNPALKPVKVALAGMEAALCQLNLADNLVVVLQKSA